MNETKRIAIVILNWNGLEFMKKFLPGVVEHSSDSGRVVVADNGSTDGSREWIAESFPELEYIQLDHNYGFAEGYNRALEQIDAEFYLLLNSDIEVTEGWLVPLLELMDSSKKIAAIQPKILAYYRPKYFEYAGASGGFIDSLGFPFCRGRILGNCEKDRGQYDSSREVFWATGAALLVRSELYNSLGGLDKSFFAHQEEIDFCWRLKRAGYEIAVEPKSVVYHVGGGTLPESSPFKSYLNYRNNLAMLYKNLAKWRFILVYLMRFLTDFLQMILNVVTGKFSMGGSVFKGHRDFWRMHRKLNRHKELGFRPVGSVYKGSIILRYIFGGKTFGKIL